MARRKAEEFARRKVRLRYDIETRAGTKFPKGSICRVRYVDRGKLCLEMPNPDPNNIFGDRWLSISHVEPHCVELLPHGGLVEPPAEALAAAEDEDD